MKIDLKRIFDVGDEFLDLESKIDLSWIQRFNRTLLPEPIDVKVHLQNRASVLTLDYEACFKYPVMCDRCLKQDFTHEKMSFSHTIVRSLNQGDEHDGYLVVPDGILNLDEIASADIQLELPIVYLCKDDCKGLCIVCGIDLNSKNCECDKKIVDPRFDVLRKLL